MKKNKVIIIVIAFFAVLIFIDLFINKPWEKEEINVVEATTEEVEVLSTESASNHESQSIEESSAEATTDELYFLSENNLAAKLYENGEFSDEPFSISKDTLGSEYTLKIQDTLDKIYSVAHDEMDISVLKGLVDSVLLENQYKPRFNSFLEKMVTRNEYVVSDSYKISENVYFIAIILQTAAGEYIEGYQSDAIMATATYNVKDNRISFEELIQRKPINYALEDDRFKLHAYMVESTTTGSKLYISLTSKLDKKLPFEEFPAMLIKADTGKNFSDVVPFVFDYSGHVLYPGNTSYFEIQINSVINDIDDIIISGN